MPINPIAQRVKAAIEAGADLKSAAEELLTEVSPLDRAAVFDVGVNLYLVVLPGWTPLADAAQYVMLADDLS